MACMLQTTSLPAIHCCNSISTQFSSCTRRPLSSSPQSPTSQTPQGKTINSITSSPSRPFATAHRRQILPLMGFSLLVALSEPAQVHAKDIPIFGIKTLKKVEEQVVEEAKELVKEGEQEVGKLGEVVKDAAQDLEIESESLFQGPAPVVQAGVVAGAEVIGVLVASSVVNGILGTQPSD